MNDEDKTRHQLIAELEALRRRVAELEAAAFRRSEAQERREPGDGSCQAGDLTGRTDAEQERDRLRTILTAAIECLPFGLWALGPEGRYVMENAANRSVWGEVVGKSPAEVAGDERTLSLWLDNNRRAWAGEKVEGEAEFTVRGETRFYHNVIAPIRMEEQIIGILGVNVDTTDQKRAEEALRSSEAKYRRLYDSMRDAFVSVTMDGRIQEYNDAYRQMLGYEPEELAALSFRDVTPSKWHAFQNEIIEKQVLVRGYSDIYDKEYRRKDGTVVPVELRTILLKDDEGRPCGMWAVIRDITERKRNEKALRESEGRYRAVAESTKDVIYILDREGTLLFANKAASHCIGIEPGEIVGKRQADLFPPEMAEAHVEKTRRVFASGEVLEEDEVFRFGPQEIWLRVHLLPLRDDAGQVTSVMGVCHNITERKRAEKALRKAHDGLEQEVKKRTTGLAIFRRFAEASGRGFGMANLDGRITYVNPTLCRMCGEEKREDIIGKHVATYLPKGFGPKWNEELVPAVLQHGSWHSEERVLSRNGSSTPVLLNSSLIRDENGKPLRVALALADISELKKTEEALRRSEERFELAARGAGVGIWDWDIRAGKVYYSPRWKKLFGYEENEIGDEVEDWARLLHPDEREWIIKLQEDFLAGTSPTVSAEYRLRHKDGSFRWIEAHAIVVRDEQGRACRFVGSHGDITDRKRAEEALERERQSLWRMLQASDHERRIISYEIHDELAQYLAGAVMQFQSYDALRESSPDEATKAYQTAVALVRQSHTEARRLISEVRPPVIDEIGLETAISHLVHEQRRLGGPHIELHSNVQFERLASILENALYRVAQEALAIACKHSRSKKVTVSLTQEGQEAYLKVQDWGVGFDPEAVRAGHFGLEGIRQRVRLLGGRLTIESTPGSGTVIQVVVPILERQNDG